MRDVAIVSFAQHVANKTDLDETELLASVLTEAIERSGVARKEIGFTVSGSCDYLGGRPFSFVSALDAVGAWPPIAESHVEMDGAWALYEAWVRLQHGDVDTALVYAFGKSSQGDLADILVSQLDPYYVAPLAPAPTSLAELQARAMMGDGESVGTAGVVASTPGDGAAAIVLVAGDRARRSCPRPAFIRGIDHRIEPHALGARDLTRSVSTHVAAEHAGALGRRFDVAAIHAPFSHQETLIRDALGLAPEVPVNPGAGAVQPFIVTGLLRMGEAAAHVMEGRAASAVAHATSGPCLQQNLVCVLECER